jgi:bifunctional N-acetylglucosamine-1-phosphate-uridyltransferase/glucosamine-1-phosphate-acetyltransferase GlmU-like protein
MVSPQDLFSLDNFSHKSLFDSEYVWEVLKNIKSYLKETIKPNVDPLRDYGDVLPHSVILYNDKVIDSDFKIRLGRVSTGDIEIKYKNEILRDPTVVFANSSFLSNRIELGKNTVVEPGALLKENCLIGNNTEVRQGAYLRGDCLIGNRCVAGHTTEIKSSVMIDDSKAGHFAYIGDSILGNNVNLGAGTKLANLKIVESTIVIKIEKNKYETGLRKFGAIIGDKSETGCNTVTTPGTIMGSGCIVFPNTTVHPGYHPPRSLIR